MLDLRTDLVRHAARIAFCGAFPGVGDERVLRRGEGLVGFVGIFVAQLIERKATACGDLQSSGHRSLVTAIEPQDFGRTFKVPLGVGLEPVARILDRAFLADARQNILQSLAGGRVIEAIADSN